MTVGCAAAQAPRMTESAPANRRLKLALLAGLGLVGLIVLALVWRSYGSELKPLFLQALEHVRALGPVAFFGLMTILPAAGCPMSVFTLTAGPLFGPVLGMPVVLVLVWVCIALNLSLSYWLARYAMRPWLTRICNWLGYKLPAIQSDDLRGVVILVRVTPGPPYALQNYLLGLAGIPFSAYFLTSWVITSLYSCAFVIFGDAIMQGRGRMALLAFSLFTALTVAVQLLRRHYQKRAKKAQP